MSYAEIGKDLGQKIAPKIWNMFLSSNPDVFVTPYGNRDRRYRCYFDVDGIIYLHLTPTEIKNELSGIVGGVHTIFLYGAYNQQYVRQVKITGELLCFNNGGLIKQAIQDRLDCNMETDDVLKLKPNKNPEEKNNALLSLREGSLFKFTPSLYEIGEYETG